MNPLIDLYLKCLKKIKVVHSLPGRLRVNIYGIREFPDLAKEYAPVLEKTVRNLSGVTSAELGTATGNLLINYDPAKTSGGTPALAQLRLAEVLRFHAVDERKQCTGRTLHRGSYGTFPG